MPVDQLGNRADVVADPLATIGRSILGRVYEPKFNAAFRDLVYRMKQKLGITSEKISDVILQSIDSDGRVMTCFQELVAFYKIVSPDHMFVWFTQHITQPQIYKHMTSVFSGRRTLFMPPDNEPGMHEITMQINEQCPNHIGPVSYVGNSGKRVTTKENVLIGSAYIYALDKTGTDYAAVNSARLQHHGVLAQLNNTNKYAAQIRLQPPRFWGESEYRILSATTDPVIVAEIIDRSNNRDAMEMSAFKIITSKNPMDIAELVDRKTIPYGENRPIQIQRHTAECFGWSFTYTQYQPDWGPIKPVQGNGPLTYPAPVIDRGDEV